MRHDEAIVTVEEVCYMEYRRTVVEWQKLSANTHVTELLAALLKEEVIISTGKDHI